MAEPSTSCSGPSIRVDMEPGLFKKTNSLIFCLVRAAFRLLFVSFRPTAGNGASVLDDRWNDTPSEPITFLNTAKTMPLAFHLLWMMGLLALFSVVPILPSAVAYTLKWFVLVFCVFAIGFAGVITLGLVVYAVLFATFVMIPTLLGRVLQVLKEEVQNDSYKPID